MNESMFYCRDIIYVDDRMYQCARITRNKHSNHYAMVPIKHSHLSRVTATSNEARSQRVRIAWRTYP